MEINRLVIVLFLLSIQLVNCGKLSSPGDMQMAASIVIMNSYSQPLTQSKSIIEDTADTVTDAPYHTGVGFRDSRLAVNGIRGAGNTSGSGDVFSLANTGNSASITIKRSAHEVEFPGFTKGLGNRKNVYGLSSTE